MFCLSIHGKHERPSGTLERLDFPSVWFSPNLAKEKLYFSSVGIDFPTLRSPWWYREMETRLGRIIFFFQLNQKTESFPLKVNQELLGAKGSEGDVETGVVMISKTLLNVWSIFSNKTQNWTYCFFLFRHFSLRVSFSRPFNSVEKFHFYSWLPTQDY